MLNMKCLSLVVAFLLSTCVSSAQTYSVVHVEGTILFPSTKKAWSTGDQLTLHDSITFPKLLSWAVVASPTGDLFFIQHEKTTTTTLQQVMSPIEKGQHPLKHKNKLPVKDLKTYFAGEQFVFIGNDFSLAVDSSVYPLDEKLFLLYRYEYNSRIITHKLPQTQHVVAFDPTFLYEYKGEKIPYQKTTHTEISYFDSHTNFPTYAAGFRPVWLNEGQLKKELQVLQALHSNKKNKESKADFKKTALQYVQDIYGQTDEVYFNFWMDNFFSHP